MHFSRRQFVRLSLTGLIGSPLVRGLADSGAYAQSPVVAKNTASTCIFIYMLGGPSQMETWDPKEGSWVPGDLDIRSYAGGVTLSHKLFPILSRNVADLVVLRSLQAWEAIHERGQYYLQTSYADLPDLSRQLPCLGSVTAYESESSRTPDDFLPPFLAIGVGDLLPFSAGFLSRRYAPFKMPFTYIGNGIPNLHASIDADRLSKRIQLLESLEGANPGSYGGLDDNAVAAEWARTLLTRDLDPIFRLDKKESEHYGNNYFGDQCLLARNLIRADAGVRFLALFQGGWDHHFDLFDPSNPMGLYRLAFEFDTAVGNLLEDLKAGGQLEKTLIVAMGEFGRTPGPLNSSKGRDHYRAAQVALLAGGGTRGPKAIGATDPNGGFIVDYGWSGERPIRMEDITATIYSALGINWTKTISTPSGWTYEYVRHTEPERYRPIDEVF